MNKGYFITGTDTGVGKTLVTSALVYGFAEKGFKAAALKPVAAGCAWHDGSLLSEDVAQLVAASNVELPAAIVNAYSLEPPVAPHIAARQAGVEIDLGVIQQACERASGSVDILLVEGVGGFRVPFSDEADSADLAMRLGLPLIMVVGMRLGCLNHAVLTAEAIAARGLRMAGWVANRIDPDMLVFEENLEALEARLEAPCLGGIPWLQDPCFKDAASFLGLERLR